MKRQATILLVVLLLGATASAALVWRRGQDTAGQLQLAASPQATDGRSQHHSYVKQHGMRSLRVVMVYLRYHVYIGLHYHKMYITSTGRQYGASALFQDAGCIPKAVPHSGSGT